jgi:hypothetical protein
MGELGAQYPEVIALLQQAASCDSLTCRVRIDALPQAIDVRELVKAGRSGSDFGASGQDLGRTPSLYQIGLPASEGTR